MRLTLPAAKWWHIGWMGYPGHKGQDTGWGSGDRVVAAAPGTVVEVYKGGGFNGGFGNRIVIEHAPGVYTTYNHLATGTVLPRLGESVARGQEVARMGSTGLSTAKHLHFELELGGRGPAYRVDPAPYYSRDLPGTAADAHDKTPASPEEEDIMDTRQLIAKPSKRRALFVPGTSYFVPWIESGATYANNFAKGLDTGSAIEVTDSLFDALQRGAAALLPRDRVAVEVANAEAG